MKTLIRPVMTILALITLSVLPAMAQQQNDTDNQTLDKAQAAERAKQKVNGRVLRVEKSRDNYRVKMLKKSGRVVSVDVDKRSGEVRSPQDKDKKR